MIEAENFDRLFQQAVNAIDAGDEAALQDLLNTNPQLATQRLYTPGQWLTSVIGDALKGFYKDPYLLWFVSEDAVRTGKLQKNIAQIAAIIIEKIKSSNHSSLQEQLDYTLKLVGYSRVAQDCNVQIGLLDVLIDAGAEIGTTSTDALVNAHFDAAKHLIKRGGELTLPTALCLEMWPEADALAANASGDVKQFSLVLCALNGKAEGVRKALSYGADINKPSNDLYPHATPLHHAVSSGSLETVEILVNAGADLNAVDTAWDGTPLGWAEYGGREEIVYYLKKALKSQLRRE
ncbi:MAG TPA: ankyrin repeat domain-containing protein [Cyclobacteriaceae bacterium]|nr:ankyrin repeat domain-containing protein [Cyclobacteriaceae bacterium]